MREKNDRRNNKNQSIRMKCWRYVKKMLPSSFALLFAICSVSEKRWVRERVIWKESFMFYVIISAFRFSSFAVSRLSESHLPKCPHWAGPLECNFCKEFLFSILRCHLAWVSRVATSREPSRLPSIMMAWCHVGGANGFIRHINELLGPLIYL